MEVLALAVLFAVMQASPPVPRKTPNNPAQTTTQVKSKGTSSQAEPLPAPAKADGSGPAKADSGLQHPEDEQHTVGISKLPPVTVTPAKRDWADWAYWGFNFLLVAVGGFQVYLLFRTLHAVNRQAEETGRQVEVTAGQLRAMNEQITEMSVQSGILKESVQVSRDAAKAAQDGANAAKESADATRDSVEAFISKERARLRIVVLPFDSNTSPITTFVKYRVDFHGNADAFISASAAYALITSSKIPDIDDERAEIFKIALPDVIGPNTDMVTMHMVHAYSDEIVLPIALLVDVINKARAFLHFYAFIKYRTLDDDRETRVCQTWEVNPAVNALAGSSADHWKKSGPPGANRDT
jgi:hypothetical protein